MPIIKSGCQIGAYEITQPCLSFGAFANTYLAQKGASTYFLKQYSNPTCILPWYKEFIAYQETLQQRLKGLGTVLIGTAVELFEEDRTYYQVFEYMRGEDLSVLFERACSDPKALPDDKRWQIAKVFIQALATAHGAGIVHCDLKPQNIFLCTSATAPGFTFKLIDFDFSFLEGTIPPWAPQDHTKNKPGYVGTPNYLSPEHLGTGKPTRKSDIFTAGLILYELLCGTQPYAATSNEEFARIVAANAPPDPSSINKGIHRKLADTLRSCLASEPARRPDAPTLLTALENVGVATFIKLTGATNGGYVTVQEAQIVLGARNFRSFANTTDLHPNAQFQITRVATGTWRIKSNTAAAKKTTLNGREIDSTYVDLHDGDTIRVGTFQTRVEFGYS